jgi:hypothetical protein
MKKGKSKPGFKPKGDMHKEKRVTKRHGGKGRI